MRPSVTIHYAQTLDGRIASRNGESRWISGDRALRLAHELRATHDAVLVGIGTVIVDDPQLTVRLVPGRSPIRIIVDSGLRIPLSARVLTDAAAPTIVAGTERARPGPVAAVRARGAEVLLVEADETGRVDLPKAFDALRRRGIRSLLVEGGSAIITSTLRQRLADRLVVSIAPKVLGTGVEAVGDLDISALADALTFSRARFVSLGADIVFDGVIDHAEVGVA
jgi:riboflavin-specific deaminase-like protein